MTTSAAAAAGRVITGNVAAVCPGVIVTVAGTAANSGRPLASEITKPAAPAGKSVPTRPVAVSPPATGFGFNASIRTLGARTVTIACFAVPFQRTVTTPRCGAGTGAVTRVNPAVVAPSGTVTAAGAVSAGFVVEIVTTAPPAGAGAVSVTAPLTFWNPPTGVAVSSVRERIAGFGSGVVLMQ